MRKLVILLLLALFLGSSFGLFAQSGGGWDGSTHFDGDALNTTISNFIKSVSDFMPNSTTNQNVWSLPAGVPFGFGLNGNVTFVERNDLSKVLDGGGGFGGNNVNLTEFPEGLPNLPAGAFDLRLGRGRMDFGVTGMWINSQVVPVLEIVLGEDSDFDYRTLGFDVRYLILHEAGLIPAVHAQAGYYFTWMTTTFESGESESISIDIRNDSYMIGVQASKNFDLIKPYFGLKLIFAKTDSEFEWKTGREVRVLGETFDNGAIYKSGLKAGDLYTYFQIYGGVGISFIFPHVATIGVSYNAVTGHFGVNAAARLIIEY